MYHSTFLVNRQMITDLSQIMTSLSLYKDNDGNKFENFFYRLEWYRIGISIPMDLYSEKMPAFQLRPECQLTHSEKLQELPQDSDEIYFKIFIRIFHNAQKFRFMFNFPATYTTAHFYWLTHLRSLLNFLEEFSAELLQKHFAEYFLADYLV